MRARHRPSPELVIKDGRIAAIGSGLDGDEVVGCTGRGVLPGLFDCHVHLIAGSPSSWCNSIDDLHEPFSMQFFRAALNMCATLATGITTVRDGCGADLGIKVAQERTSSRTARSSTPQENQPHSEGP